MNARIFTASVALWSVVATSRAEEQQDRYLGTLKMDVPHISSDASVEYDFPIIYVRAPRRHSSVA